MASEIPNAPAKANADRRCVGGTSNSTMTMTAASARTGIDADQARLRQWVAQHGLRDCPADPERGADQEPEQEARQPDFTNDLYGLGVCCGSP